MNLSQQGRPFDQSKGYGRVKMLRSSYKYDRGKIGLFTGIG